MAKKSLAEKANIALQVAIDALQKHNDDLVSNQLAFHPDDPVFAANVTGITVLIRVLRLRLQYT